MPEDNVKYINAPVSEVIFGASFQAPITDDQIFEFRNKIKEEYPLLEYSQPVGDEWLVGYLVTGNINSQFTGPLMFRSRSSDHKYLVQIQKNKLFVNWIRFDQESPGSYPGFGHLKAEFQRLFSILNSITGDLPSNTLYSAELTYHDRVEWLNSIESISDINKITSMHAPFLSDDVKLNNVFSRFTFECPKLDGFGTMGVNTKTSSNGTTQLLQVEFVLRGKTNSTTFADWLDNANELHKEYFENFFTKSLRESWK